MGKLVFVTGGARSGKSTFAEKLTREKPGKSVYIATAVPCDAGMAERIRRHRAARPAAWQTIERFKDYRALHEDPDFKAADNVLFDCAGVMVTNQMFERGANWEDADTAAVNAAEAAIQADVRDLIAALREKDSVVVSNEVGSGIVPANYFSSYFRDILGRVNQTLAAEADEVYLCVSGIPVKIKG